MLDFEANTTLLNQLRLKVADGLSVLVYVNAKIAGNPLQKATIQGWLDAELGKGNAVLARGWIAVDLDNTLAEYNGGVDTIGAPTAMVQRVKDWLEAGEDVRIFTARVAGEDAAEQLELIHAWCLEHIGTILPVTNEKDHEMIEMWDDRAVRVEDGEPISDHTKTDFSEMHKAAGELKRLLKYSYGNVQVNIPDTEPVVEVVRAIQARIPASALMAKGLEKESHITVRYGLLDNDFSRLIPYLATLKPFQANAYKLSYFPATPNSDGATVIILKVNSGDLYQINRVLPLYANYKPADFDYNPHITVAYVNPEAYLDFDQIEPVTFTVSSLTICPKDGEPIIVPLMGGASNKLSKAHPALEGRIAAFLRKTGDDLAKRIRRAPAKKASGSEEERVQLIAEAIDWQPLVVEVQPDLEDATVEGSSVALGNIGFTGGDLLVRANKTASAWARNRAAEMVGMKWEGNRLIPNPNADWAISKTTRDQVREIVTRAFQGGVSRAELARQIQEADAFSPARAQMIAKTELKQAASQGNLLGWKATGVIEEINVELSADHDQDDECDDAEAGNPYPIDEAPRVPLHPHCECSYTIAQVASKLSKLAKYEDDEARDEKGQWTSGGAGSIDSKDERTETWSKNTVDARPAAEKPFETKLPEGHPDRVIAERVIKAGKDHVDSFKAKDPEFKALSDKSEDLTRRLSNNEMLQRRATSNLDKMRDKVFLTSDRSKDEATLADPNRGAIVAKYEAESNKLDTLCKRGGKLEQERLGVNRDINARVASWSIQGEKPTTRITVIGEKDVADHQAEAINGVQRMTGGAPLDGNFGHLYVANQEGVRAYSQGSTIVLDPKDKGAVVAHEMGHWYEGSVRGGDKAAQAYLNYRTHGESAQSLDSLTRQKDFARYGSVKDTGYRADEIAKPDKFDTPYTGKIYEHGSTEITSMGFQRLWEDPGKFYRDDRDHFHFTMGMLRAGKHGGWHRIPE